jgi:hypothetical protein
MSDNSVVTPIMRNPPLVAYHDDGTSCTTSRIKWELDCLLGMYETKMISRLNECWLISVT